MRFSPSFLDEIRDRVPISDVIGKRVTWDRRKTNVSRGDYWACWPVPRREISEFHCEDRKGRYIASAAAFPAIISASSPNSRA